MSFYQGAINYIDSIESKHLQQGNHIDVSCYSFDELMFELRGMK